MSVLLTGGLGYIGSHTAVELLENGESVVVVDNLSNSQKDVAKKIEKIVEGKVDFRKNFKLYIGDVRNQKLMNRIFAKNKIDSVVHFAGLKAVGESCKIPLNYYKNNIDSTLVLLDTMKRFGVRNFVFSSSATVYGAAKKMPIFEDFETGNVTNPYGRTKLFIEQILMDLYASDKTWNIALLRYFNPIGAHDSGLIGENPNGIPNNLMPYISRVASGKLDHLNIFGNDYNTKDGTGVRDYIHVVDLANGHLCAIKKLRTNCGLKIYNLGTGIGYSVLDIVNAFNKVCGNKVKYEFAPRRPGDIDVCYANADKAFAELGWKAKRDLENMCKTSYNFEMNLKK